MRDDNIARIAFLFVKDEEVKFYGGFYKDGAEIPLDKVPQNIFWCLGSGFGDEIFVTDSDGGHTCKLNDVVKLLNSAGFELRAYPDEKKYEITSFDDRGLGILQVAESMISGEVESVYYLGSNRKNKLDPENIFVRSERKSPKSLLSLMPAFRILGAKVRINKEEETIELAEQEFKLAA